MTGHGRLRTGSWKLEDVAERVSSRGSRVVWDSAAATQVWLYLAGKGMVRRAPVDLIREVGASSIRLPSSRSTSRPDTALSPRLGCEPDSRRNAL